MPNSSQITPTPVRLPAELKTWIQESARANYRSVNAEIIAILTCAKQAAQQQQTPQ
jgi:hypothetical protein